jgi:hypothetical protein
MYWPMGGASGSIFSSSWAAISMVSIAFRSRAVEYCTENWAALILIAALAIESIMVHTSFLGVFAAGEF